MYLGETFLTSFFYKKKLKYHLSKGATHIQNVRVVFVFSIHINSKPQDQTKENVNKSILVHKRVSQIQK